MVRLSDKIPSESISEVQQHRVFQFTWDSTSYGTLVRVLISYWSLFRLFWFSTCSAIWCIFRSPVFHQLIVFQPTLLLQRGYQVTSTLDGKSYLSNSGVSDQISSEFCISVRFGFKCTSYSIAYGCIQRQRMVFRFFDQSTTCIQDFQITQAQRIVAFSAHEGSIFIDVAFRKRDFRSQRILQDSVIQCWCCSSMTWLVLLR